MSPLPPPGASAPDTGRETRDVNLPPPLPPPPAPPAGAQEPWNWDRLQPLAKRWFQPLLERETWMAVLYLVVGMCSAVGFFIALNVVGWLTFGLLFAGIGIFLVRPFFAMVEALARAELTMPAWIGVEIEPRPITPMRGLGLRAAIDPERWRQVGFLALNIVIGIVVGNLGVAAFGVAPQVAFTDPFSGGWLGLGPLAWAVSFALAVVLFGAAPRIAKFVAGFKAQVTAWFLGVDQLAAAQRRVTDLSTQRQDILDAVASERRRIERNLHDGVQQQLVAIGLDLGMAEQQLGADPDRARELIVSARQKVQGSIGELRQLGRGLHPAILADRGIDAALSAVVAGSSIPISVHVDPGLDLSTDVAETVYFVANEALANVLKHAKARRRVGARHEGRGQRPGHRPRRRSRWRRPGQRDGDRRHPRPCARGRRQPVDQLTGGRPHHARRRDPTSPSERTSTTMNTPIRTVVADDSVLLRDGIVRLLSDSGFEVVAAVGDADALLDAVTEHAPDLCVVDVRMPPSHTDEGLRAAIEIRRRHPGIAVLVLSQYVEERYAGELLSGDIAGVGYLLKDRVIAVDDFLASLRRVAGGGSAVDAEVISQILGRSRRGGEIDRLTPREREVLTLMAEGLSNTGIAERLVVSAGAVEKHISNVFMKLGLEPEDGAHRRVLAVLTYLRA